MTDEKLKTHRGPGGRPVLEEVVPAEPPHVRAAQRKGQDALRRAASVPTRLIPKANRRELADAAGQMRQALHGNSRYTPPARKSR